MSTMTAGKVSDVCLPDTLALPKGCFAALDLLRPIYEKTAAYGHFGLDEPEFTWERTDKAAALRAAAGL